MTSHRAGGFAKPPAGIWSGKLRPNCEDGSSAGHNGTGGTMVAGNRF